MKLTVHQSPRYKRILPEANVFDKAVKIHSGKENKDFNICIILSDEGKENISKG